MMHLYGSPKTRSTRVAWTLEEAGFEYDYTAIDLRKGQGFQPPFIQLNPAGKVPVLVDGELVLTESAAISIYIADKVPEQNLIPRVNTAARAIHNQWCFFAVSELEQPLWLAAKHRFVFPEERRVPSVIPTAMWEFERQLAVLAKGLGDKPYIMGEQFTIADIMISHILTWAVGANLSLNQVNLEAYLARNLARPALARASKRELQALSAAT